MAAPKFLKKEPRVFIITRVSHAHAARSPLIVLAENRNSTTGADRVALNFRLEKWGNGILGKLENKSGLRLSTGKLRFPRKCSVGAAMDDGKCLLDVISDPQALKEFFRSTSQLAFVEGKVPPLTDKPDNKQGTTNNISRNDNVVFSTTNSQSSNNQPSQSISTSSAHINKQSTPLAHLSFLSNAGNAPGNFLGNKASSINNGVQTNTGTSNLTTASNSRSINLASNNHNLVTSGIQSVNNLGSTKPLTIGIPSSQPANVPLSFGFGDASKARNILSTSSVPLLTVAKPTVASAKQSVTQQSTPPRLVASPQAGLSATVRPQNLKSSPLPILRPKGIAPRPQNTLIPGAQNNSQITIQGNVLTQGPKTTPMKGQPQLVAIRPKIVIAQPNTSGSGLDGQTNSGNSTARPKQAVQNTFTLGGKGQPQLPKQILNTLTVPHLKQGMQNQAVGKSGLASLVQLQPKQIAPKPEQVSTAQIGKAKLTQDLQVQTALLQSLLAQGQFGVQTNAGQKDLKQGTNLGQDNSAQQQKLFVQQNQLKKLIQQNQLVQQALQVRQAQQQQQQLTQSQQAHTQQQQQHTQSHSQQQQQHTQQQQQNMALLQMKSPPLNTNNTTMPTQQVKLQVPSSQITLNAANLASQLKEAINTKQLQQFLEKNPIVAQQLKQLNMRQAGLAVNARQQGVSGNTVTVSSATPVKTVTQLQKPTATIAQVQKGTVNQLQTVTQLQKSTINLNQKPSLTIGQFQKPAVINQLAKPTANVNQLQKPAVSSITHLQKGVTTNITQIAKPAVIPNPKKVISIPSTGQVTQITTLSAGTNIQTSNQKPVTGTTQKVVIVQNANSMPTLTPGQPKVLLQTKEGRPILLSQEQFRQIQAQLASKNLSIQGKLVTAAPVTTTTATTVKPQVVVKTEATTPKVNQKVLPATAKTPSTKQEVTKNTKRPIKAVETEESKLIKRMKLTVQKDQNDVCFTDIHKPFKSQQDAITCLTPYHVYSEPIPNARMQHKANALLDKLALQLTHKSDKMINKYRQLLLSDMQRDVPSAEVVMVNRIYLADEKAALLKEKQTMLEEAKQMAKEARANLSQMKTNPNATPNSTDTTTTNQLSTDCTTIHPDTSEPIDISDDDSSPITSANSFLTHISNSRTDNNVVNRALEPG
ncbi:Hypothetical predicted protein [Paramuricea clavata]|uniref:Uncharacterized protein n=1 Tax=Paramuricea clavata TaxID=317549 RepID=A0A6S7FYS6_PARCT|nr:Hypothetical predicted protein [Paramuricea clavata]